MIPSPTYTLALQKGNCFDYAILLTSFLKGVGYDAFVVSGYATNTITLLDETKSDAETVGLPPPFSTGKVEEEKKVEGGIGGKYRVKPGRTLQSNFVVKQEAKRKMAEAELGAARRKEMERMREVSCF